MVYDLANQQFHAYEDTSKLLNSWIASKDAHFYPDVVWALPGRWEKLLLVLGYTFNNLFASIFHN